MSLSLDEARAGLASDEEEIRRGAVARLGTPASPGEAAQTLDFLVEAMGDSSWRVRKEAAARAAAFADPTLAARVIEPLLHTPTLRAAALEALGRTGERSVLATIGAALSDPARSTRDAAIRALAELYRRLDPIGREAVSNEVAAHRDAMPALTTALLEATLGTQRDAALLLGLFKRPEAARPLVLALGDRDLREAAMQALAMIGAPAAETLAALAPDLESALRADAYALLPRLGPAASDPRVQAQLAEALDDDSVEAASSAATALGEVGGREALAPLLRALNREESVAHAAADALGRLGARHYDEVRVLVQSRGLHGPDAPYLCRALGACGRADDAPFLRQALGADASAVRRSAAEALAQLPSSPEVDEALTFALADEAVDVRA